MILKTHKIIKATLILVLLNCPGSRNSFLKLLADVIASASLIQLIAIEILDTHNIIKVRLIPVLSNYPESRNSSCDFALTSLKMHP